MLKSHVNLFLYIRMKIVSPIVGRIKVQFLATPLVKSDYSGRLVLLILTNTLM